MKPEQLVEPYNILADEKVSYGYYMVLETIFHNYVSMLESYLFDELGISFQIDFSIEAGIKFKDVFTRHNYPLPIFLFELSPLKGSSLMIFENRCSNFFLQKEELIKFGKTGISNLFKVEGGNAARLRKEVDRLLWLFTDSWSKITPTEFQLRKMVSHRLKAKVMGSYETCVIVHMDLKHKGFQTGWQFCFSGYQLDPIMKEFGKKALLTGTGEVYQDPKNKEFLENILLNEVDYKIEGVLGELEISHKDLDESFENNKVLPLNSSIEDNITIKVNGVPLLASVVGQTHDKISLRVDDRLDKVKRTIRKKEKPFTKLRFPIS